MIGKFNLRTSVKTKENVKVESDKMIVAKESNDAADAKDVESGEDELDECVKRQDDGRRHRGEQRHEERQDEVRRRRRREARYDWCRQDEDGADVRQDELQLDKGSNIFQGQSEWYKNNWRYEIANTMMNWTDW